MTPRTTMTTLISRLGKLLPAAAAFTDDDLQEMLDGHAFTFDVSLVPRLPFYKQHEAPYENIEAGAGVYTGYNQVLVEGTDYTIDLSRGIVSTPAADRRGLMIQGSAYDLNAAAADGWERVAAAHVGEFDVSHDDGSSLKRSQVHDQALTQAAKYQSKAWATQTSVERSDMTGSGDTTANRLREGFRRTDQ
jgi:hypothetical protein